MVFGFCFLFFGFFSIENSQLHVKCSNHFETILRLSETLLEDIEARMSQWNARTQIGDIFLKIVEFLKIYTGYIENFDASIALRQSLSEKSKFKSLVSFEFLFIFVI